ncbi:MAG: phosphoribosyl-AMP cyclohydrolase, partial [Chthoniobacterales bacterium]
KKLWFNGDSSGHPPDFVRWFADCDKECLLFEVKQATGACHTGYESCFFQGYDMQGSALPVAEKPAFDADKTYAKK